MRRYIKEIAITTVVFVILVLVWHLWVGDSITLTDQGILRVGTVFSATLGVFSAVAVSLLFVVWQFSRQQRDTSFWRFRNFALQLVRQVDSKFQILSPPETGLVKLTTDAQQATPATPLPKDVFNESASNFFSFVWNETEKVGSSSTINPLDAKRIRVYLDAQHLVGSLAVACVDHNNSNEAYRIILSLLDSCYRLAVVLLASLFLVVLSASSVFGRVPDTFNAPIVVTLIGWVVWLLICLGKQINEAVLLEKGIKVYYDSLPRAQTDDYYVGEEGKNYG